MDFGVSKRVLIIALAVLALIYFFKLTSSDAFQINPQTLLNTVSSDKNAASTNTHDLITNKVAVITDTQYSPRLVPLILHYHAVLGPDWPIVFYTSEETLEKHFNPESANTSAIWNRAVQDGSIQIRPVPAEFNLTSRDGVNIYLSRPWLWEQLAPAQHVLVFQTDAILCGNSYRTMDDFLEWDFIGAPIHDKEHLYNGGLSLRNRTMLLDILNDGGNWEEETKSGKWTMGGEDVWFSKRMDQRGAHLPSNSVGLTFACEYSWNFHGRMEPLGFHKVHKNAADKLEEIADWCPEIALAAPGKLAG
ncbi:hypothetical protein B7463_g8493, partial [Scytalidium lignicola]